ncbi:DUF7167 family protein [Streptomyces griseorubiginosus]|uniref:DUF7167 family protein n=1 Tax=Streptomyces griseorubiginosus TaxID=67304 RepID=UPI0036E73570
MTQQPTTRITLYVGMNAIAGSMQELVIEGDDIPDGWDDMTDAEKEAAIAPTLDVFLANELDYGWTVDTA